MSLNNILSMNIVAYMILYIINVYNMNALFVINTTTYYQIEYAFTIQNMISNCTLIQIFHHNVYYQNTQKHGNLTDLTEIVKKARSFISKNGKGVIFISQVCHLLLTLTCC